MTGKSKKETYEHLTHLFHEKYRTSGIALCLSLAAFAVSESWWFYSFHENVIETESYFQILLYASVVLLAPIVIFLSFYVQYRHYQGMKHMARSYYNAYKEEDTKENEGNSKNEMEKRFKEKKDEEWDDGTKFLTKADCGVTGLFWTALVNFVADLFYIVLFTPSKP